jgi:hypothetical protein
MSFNISRLFVVLFAIDSQVARFVNIFFLFCAHQLPCLCKNWTANSRFRLYSFSLLHTPVLVMQELSVVIVENSLVGRVLLERFHNTA